jgi:hypothetical protein
MPLFNWFKPGGGCCCEASICACEPPLEDLTVTYNGVATGVFTPPPGYTSGNAPLIYRGFTSPNHIWETDCTTSGAASFKVKLIWSLTDPKCIEVQIGLFNNGTCTGDPFTRGCRMPCVEATGFCASGTNQGIIYGPSSSCAPFLIYAYSPANSCVVLQSGGSLVITL